MGFVVEEMRGEADLCVCVCLGCGEGGGVVHLAG